MRNQREYGLVTQLIPTSLPAHDLEYRNFFPYNSGVQISLRIQQSVRIVNTEEMFLK